MEEALPITWEPMGRFRHMKAPFGVILGKSSEKFLKAVAHCRKRKGGSKMTLRAIGNLIPTGPMPFWTPKVGWVIVSNSSVSKAHCRKGKGVQNDSQVPRTIPFWTPEVRWVILDPPLPFPHQATALGNFLKISSE